MKVSLSKLFGLKKKVQTVKVFGSRWLKKIVWKDVPGISSFKYYAMALVSSAKMASKEI